MFHVNQNLSTQSVHDVAFVTCSAGENFTDVYIKPWCRIGPYVVGFFAGYILYKTECKLKLTKVIMIQSSLLYHFGISIACISSSKQK